MSEGPWGTGRGEGWLASSVTPGLTRAATWGWSGPLGGVRRDQPARKERGPSRQLQWPGGRRRGGEPPEDGSREKRAVGECGGAGGPGRPSPSLPGGDTGPLTGGKEAPEEQLLLVPGRPVLAQLLGRCGQRSLLRRQGGGGWAEPQGYPAHSGLSLQPEAGCSGRP